MTKNNIVIFLVAFFIICGIIFSVILVPELKTTKMRGDVIRTNDSIFKTLVNKIGEQQAKIDTLNKNIQSLEIAIFQMEELSVKNHLEISDFEKSLNDLKSQTLFNSNSVTKIYQEFDNYQRKK